MSGTNEIEVKEYVNANIHYPKRVTVPEMLDAEGQSATETALLDGALAGTVVNSKAAAYSSTGMLFRSSGEYAAAGANLAAATDLTDEYCVVTGADNAKGVSLMVPAADKVCTVLNTDTTSNLLVYPDAAGNQINALGAGVAITLTPGQEIKFIGRSATQWYAPTATDTIAGLTASAAELNLNDGSVVANSVASKTAMVDSNKRLQTNAANGTPEAGVTAVHYGDGVNVTAVLTVTNVALTVGSSENLGVGALLYTLPAGACLIRDAFMSLAIAGVSSAADTPEVGLGTVIASGVVTQLDGTATFENIITGQVAGDTNGTATVKGTGPTAGAPLEIATAGAHTIYANAADGWGANADPVGTLNGTVVISYIRQAA